MNGQKPPALDIQERSDKCQDIADVCKGKFRSVNFLEFVKVISTCGKTGVDFTFSIKVFEKRIIIGKNIIDIIRDNGYTKSSFAKVMDITRPTLDQLLAGEIDSLTELNQYIEKIKTVQGITEEQLLKYVPKYNSNNDLRFIVNNEARSNDQLSSIHSFNALKNHEMNESAKEMFSILNDVLTICEVYYSRNGI